MTYILKNYIQSFDPLRYIYLIEKDKKKLRVKIFGNFIELFLFSLIVNSVSKEFSDKIFHISDVSYVKSSFSYSKNIEFYLLEIYSYLPNLLACRNFIIKVLPVLRRKISEIKFCIIGSIFK